MRENGNLTVPHSRAHPSRNGQAPTQQGARRSVRHSVVVVNMLVLRLAFRNVTCRHAHGRKAWQTANTMRAPDNWLQRPVYRGVRFDPPGSGLLKSGRFAHTAIASRGVMREEVGSADRPLGWYAWISVLLPKGCMNAPNTCIRH